MTAWKLGRALVVVVPMALGCAGSAAQAGLSNAPSEDRPWDDADRAEDVIANGQGSCPKSGKPEDDPLRYRRPRCRELGARPYGSGTIVPVSSPTNSSR